MPRVRVTRARMAKAGLRRIVRSAYRKSLSMSDPSENKSAILQARLVPRLIPRPTSSCAAT
jgi:hypothetical protein